MEGWIKIHRKIVDNSQYFSETFTRTQAWIDLLILANHKEGFVRKRGIRVELKRGDIGYSFRELSSRWRWSIGKIIRFLDELEIDGMIVTQKNNISSCISIVNYSTYQDNGTQIDTQIDTQIEHKQVRNKNEKNDKKEYHDFISILNKITGREFKGDKKSEGQFNARILSGYNLVQIELAIKNCFNDDFHKLNRKYLTPEFITREDKLQKYYIDPKHESIKRKDTFEIGETDKLMMS